MDVMFIFFSDIFVIGVTSTPVPECRNKHQRASDCDVWAKYDHCETNPSWMHDNCAKACLLCTRYV